MRTALKYVTECFLCLHRTSDTEKLGIFAMLTNWIIRDIRPRDKRCIMPILDVRNVKINFPFEPYPCQVDYMKKVIECLQEVSWFWTFVWQSLSWFWTFVWQSLSWFWTFVWQSLSWFWTFVWQSLSWFWTFMWQSLSWFWTFVWQSLSWFWTFVWQSLSWFWIFVWQSLSWFWTFVWQSLNYCSFRY